MECRKKSDITEGGKKKWGRSELKRNNIRGWETNESKQNEEKKRKSGEGGRKLGRNENKRGGWERKTSKR